MSIVAEFKEFIARGNVVDLAVGVVIGGAFGKIVTSFVADILTPVLGIVTAGVNFTQLKIRLGGTDTAPNTLNYGQFIQNIIDFLIISVAIFVMIKAINKFKRKQPAAAPAEPSKQELLLTEIRDILKQTK